MIEEWQPGDAAQVVDAVNNALSDGKTLELLGRGTRRGYGRPVDANVVLNLSSLNGVVSYEPEELICVVGPGTPMQEVGQMLAEQGQHLAFEPPDFGPLWTGEPAVGTIGGAIMTGRNGPRRLTAGGARDHMLGIKGVNGFGDAFVAGGRVVKNVTGFDLSKLVTGSCGTLCAVTELTLKVLPAPPASVTLAIFGLDDEAAIAAMKQALNGPPVDISSAAHLPASVAVSSKVTPILAQGKSATLLRLEGFGASVESRAATLRDALAEFGPACFLAREESVRAWNEITNAAFFVGGESPLWRLSVPPLAGGTVGSTLVRELAGRCYYDWAGGAVWLETPDRDDANASVIRSVLSGIVGDDGYATLIRAGADVRTSVSPFQPLSPAVATLTENVRRQFDPEGIFNPGRMYEAF